MKAFERDTPKTQYVSAGNLATILGLNPYKPAVCHIIEKLYGYKAPRTQAMQRGMDLESEAGDRVKQYCGHLFPNLHAPEQSIYMSDDDHLCCQIDFIDHETGCVVDAKCPTKPVKALSDDYYMQIQGQLMVTGYEVGYLWYHWKDRGALVCIKANPKLQQVLSKAVELWVSQLSDPDKLEYLYPPLVELKDWTDQIQSGEFDDKFHAWFKGLKHASFYHPLWTEMHHAMVRPSEAWTWYHYN